MYLILDEASAFHTCGALIGALIKGAWVGGGVGVGLEGGGGGTHMSASQALCSSSGCTSLMKPEQSRWVFVGSGSR